MMSSRFPALLLATPLLAGCLPFAWIAPPMKAEFGGAARIPVNSELDVAGTVPISLGLQPFSAGSSNTQRSFDAGVGWNWMALGNSKPTGHGPYVEGSWLFPMGEIPGAEEEGSEIRLGLHARGHYYLTHQGDYGPGATLHGTIEWVSYSDGPFAGCSDDDRDYSNPAPIPESPYDNPPFEEDDPQLVCTTGVAVGESAIGLYLGATYAEFANQEMVWVGGGLLIRLPASLGFGFAMFPWD